MELGFSYNELQLLKLVENFSYKPILITKSIGKVQGRASKLPTLPDGRTGHLRVSHPPLRHTVNTLPVVCMAFVNSILSLVYCGALFIHCLFASHCVGPYCGY